MFVTEGLGLLHYDMFLIVKDGGGTGEDWHQANSYAAESEQLLRIRSRPLALRPHRRCPRCQACQRLPLGCPGIRGYVLFRIYNELSKTSHPRRLMDMGPSYFSFFQAGGHSGHVHY